MFTSDDRNIGVVASGASGPAKDLRASVGQSEAVLSAGTGVGDPPFACNRRRESHPMPRSKGADQQESRDGAHLWSADVTQHSDALDLEKDVFTLEDPRAIAASLKRSAEASHRRKAGPFRSAMSMLTFYINRAGETLASKQRRTLEAAKDELRALFGRESG
jgi:hypothetical protein